MDATYRTELRELNELNELNFARFDAKIELRFAVGEAKLERCLSEMTRFFFLAWAVLLVAVIGLWFKG